MLLIVISKKPIWISEREDMEMFEPFDEMFDFNRDGELDSWERAAEYYLQTK